MRVLTDPDHTISLPDKIRCFEICGNDFAYNLVAVATRHRLSLILVGLPEETETGRFGYTYLQNLELDDNIDRCVRAIAFSPDTSLNCTPNNVTLCAARGDRVDIFRTDLGQFNTVQKLRGHKSYINDLSWVCDGELVASVSDDLTCRFWNLADEQNVITFYLTSPGMSIKGHPEDQTKVLVAEKKGIIRLYNVKNRQAVITVQTPKFPLMSADWLQSNRVFITAMAGGDLVTWDLNRPVVPTDEKAVHEDGGRAVRFAPGNNEMVIASIGRPDQTLKVFTAKSTMPLIEAALITFGGLAWHHRLPYISAVSDRDLHFWKVEMK